MKNLIPQKQHASIPDAESISWRSVMLGTIVGIVLIGALIAAYRYFPVSLSLPMMNGAGGVAIEGFVPGLMLISEIPEVPQVYVPVDGEYRLLEEGAQAPHETKSRVTVRSAETGYGLYLDDKLVFSSSEPLRDPALSPDGTRILFAQLMQGKRGADSLRPSSWHVDSLTVGASTTPKNISAGVLPIFIDDAHFLVFADAGIFRVDADTGASTQVHKESFAVRIPNFVLSPDRTKIAWTKLPERTTTVYSVGGTSGLTPVVLVPEAPDSMALADHRLYVLRESVTNEGELQVWAYPFTREDPQILLWIPAALGITSLAL